MKYRVILFFVILAITLGFGWWPFVFSKDNSVKWVRESSALQFGGGDLPEYAGDAAAGMAWHPRILDTSGWDGMSLYLEARGRPRGGGLGVMVELIDVEGDAAHPPLKVAQWQQHLAARSGRSTEERRRGYSEIGFRDCLDPDVFGAILISYDGDGTEVFASGGVSASYPGFDLLDPAGPKRLALVFGNDATGKEPFWGDLRRVAVYASALEGLAAVASAHPVVEYDFVVEPTIVLKDGDETDAAALVAPDRLCPLARMFFGFPSGRDLAKRGLWRDALLNVVGFLPLGGAFFVLVERRVGGMWRAVMVGIVGCFAVSFLIEIVQGFSVWRHSSLLDLVLNTVGGGAGAVVVARIRRGRLGRG